MYRPVAGGTSFNNFNYGIGPQSFKLGDVGPAVSRSRIIEET